MMCCCDIETPQSIKTEDNIDVFDTSHILHTFAPSARAGYYTKVHNAMWTMYRYRGIGHIDRDYWIEAMSDRVDLIANKYLEAFEIYEKYLQDKEYRDLAESSSRREFREGVRTTDSQNENLPSTGTAGTYLSDRSTVETGHMRADEKDVETVKVYAGLPQSTLKQALQDLADPYIMFAREFSSMFYYGL